MDGLIGFGLLLALFIVIYVGMWWCLGRCPMGGFHKWGEIKSDHHSNISVCRECGQTRRRGWIF